MILVEVETNAPYPNRIQVVLENVGDYLVVTPLTQMGPLGAFDPRRDLEIYANGSLVPIRSFLYDNTNNRYLLYTGTNIDLQGVIQVIHHTPNPPFNLTLVTPPPAPPAGAPPLPPTPAGQTQVWAFSTNYTGGGVDAVLVNVINSTSGTITHAPNIAFQNVGYGTISWSDFAPQHTIPPDATIESAIYYVVGNNGIGAAENGWPNGGSQIITSSPYTPYSSWSGLNGIGLGLAMDGTTPLGTALISFIGVAIWYSTGSTPPPPTVSTPLTSFALLASYSPLGDSGALSSTPTVDVAAIPSIIHANQPIFIVWNTTNIVQIGITGNNGVDPAFDSGVISTTGSSSYEITRGFTTNVNLTFTAYDTVGHAAITQIVPIVIT